MGFDLNKAKAAATSSYAKFRSFPRNVQIGIVVAVLVFLAYVAGRVAG